jgi:hypothetical protein
MHDSIEGVYKPMLTMLRLSKAQKHTGASGSQKFMIWEPEQLSVYSVMLCIGRQRKIVMVYLLNAV